MHIDKYKNDSGLANMLAHIERKDDEKNKVRNYANNIDKTKTDLNYSFIENNTTAYNKLQKRLEYLAKNTKRKVIRKDANVIATIVITAPINHSKECEKGEIPKTFLTEEQQKKFFKKCNEFYINKFGADNVIYSDVHNDETNPHLHFGFTPTTLREDKPVLNCRDVLTKVMFQNIHKELQEYLNKELDFKCPVLVEDENKPALGYVKLNELKNRTELMQLKEFVEEEKTILQDTLEKETQNVVSEIETLKKENLDLKSTNDILKSNQAILNKNINILTDKFNKSKNNIQIELNDFSNEIDKQKEQEKKELEELEKTKKEIIDLANRQSMGLRKFKEEIDNAKSPALDKKAKIMPLTTLNNLISEYEIILAKSNSRDIEVKDLKDKNSQLFNNNNSLQDTNDILKRDVDFEKQKVKELKEQNILKDLFIKKEGLKEKFEESKAILKQILEEQKQKILNKNKGIKR